MSKYHDILGVSPSASPEEIKKQYRQLALQHHPDKGGDEAKFKEITEAYEILTGKRQATRQSPPPPPHFDFGDLSDLFGHPFGRHGFKQARRRPRMPPERDSEIRVRMELSVEQIKQGLTGKVVYEKAKKCTDCNGVGGEKEISCNVCSGNGFIQHIQQTGNISFATEFPCPQCHGAGMKIENPCKTCEAKGFVVYSEYMNVEVKERK